MKSGPCWGRSYDPTCGNYSRLHGGGWIADTPGFSVVETPSIKREELDSYFIEFADYTSECRFSDCLHSGEKDCGVKSAVETGEICSTRYESYLCFLEEVIQKERCYKDL
jgi:ribosome biogenesis GTPase